MKQKWVFWSRVCISTTQSRSRAAACSSRSVSVTKTKRRHEAVMIQLITSVYFYHSIQIQIGGLQLQVSICNENEITSWSKNDCFDHVCVFLPSSRAAVCSSRSVHVSVTKTKWRHETVMIQLITCVYFYHSIQIQSGGLQLQVSICNENKMTSWNSNDSIDHVCVLLPLHPDPERRPAALGQYL